MKTTLGIFALALSIAAGATMANAMPGDLYDTNWQVEVFTPKG